MAKEFTIEKGVFKGWIIGKDDDSDDYRYVSRYDKDGKLVFNFNVDDSECLTDADLEKACAQGIAIIILEAIEDAQNIPKQQIQEQIERDLSCLKEIPNEFYAKKSNINAINACIVARSEEYTKNATTFSKRENVEVACGVCTTRLLSLAKSAEWSLDNKAKASETIKNDFLGRNFK